MLMSRIVPYTDRGTYLSLLFFLIAFIPGPVRCAAAPKAAPTPRSSVPIGAGLNGEIDWSRDEAFVDMIKTTRGFYALSNTNLRAKTDGNGWPLEDFWVRVSDTGVPVGAGVYKLSFNGPPGVTLDTGGSGATLRETGTTTGSGRRTFDVIVRPEQMMLEFNFHATRGQVKNLRCLRPGYADVSPPLFTREYLALIQARSPNLLRFMDWHSTNGNLESEWSERSLPTDATQTTTLTRSVHVGWSTAPVKLTNARGICWEYCVALANATGKDLWLNVPVLATEDYVRHLAALVKATLKPGLRVYVEYSNEVWNDGFLQTGLNRDSAFAEVKAGGTTLDYDKTPLTDTVTLGDRRVAKRLQEISAIFVSTFGPASLGTVVRPILAYQMAPSRFDNQLTYINAVYGKPNRFFWGMAIAPYMACGNGQGADERKDLTSGDVLDALAAEIQHLKKSKVLDEHQTLATYYGLKLCAYEGGPDTFGPNNIAAKKAASLDPRMKDLVRDYLTVWYAKGGGQFNWFVLGATSFDTQYGTWGLTDSLRDLRQPKELGFDAVRTSPPPALTVGAALPGEIDARLASGRPDPPTDPYLRYLGAGAEFDYLVRAPAAGTYLLRVSLGADKPGTTLDVFLNNAFMRTLAIPANQAGDSGDTCVDTPPLPLRLPAGLSVIRLRVPGERPYNINSLKITRVNGTGIAAALPMLGGFQFYWQQETIPGKPVTQTFTINDAQTPAADLSVSAHSDNLALLPGGNMVLSRSRTNPRSISFTATPTAGQSGQANVTFTVRNNAGLTRSVLVRIIVKAVAG